MQANGRASGPVLTSRFLAVLPHGVLVKEREEELRKDRENDAQNVNFYEKGMYSYDPQYRMSRDQYISTVFGVFSILSI